MKGKKIWIPIAVVSMLLPIAQGVFAQPYVDTGFTYSTPTDIDLVIVRENYDDTEYQQAVYFRMNADGGVLYEMGGIITFPPGISIVDVYYRRADNQPANSDICWAICGSNYSGDSRGLEDDQDPILWDENTISFRTYFAGMDDFRVIVDYGDSFPSGVSFDIELLTGPASETDYSTGIQVGNIDGVVPGSGDFGEIVQLTVPLTPVTPGEPSDVHGCIDLEGAPLIGVEVRLEQRNEITQTTTTGPDGCYQFQTINKEKDFTVNVEGEILSD